MNRALPCTNSVAFCLTFLALLTALPSANADLGSSVEGLIRDAGNAEDDAVRLEILKRLDARTDLEPELRSELGRLTAVVQRWVQWRHSWRRRVVALRRRSVGMTRVV